MPTESSRKPAPLCQVVHLALCWSSDRREGFKLFAPVHMKTKLFLFVIFVIAVHRPTARAQLMGGSPRGPSFGGSMAKLFGNNSAFTATLQLQSKGGPTDETMTIPGKLAFDKG